jgi:DNA-binding beta-propeller fold protein YncE
MSFEVGSRVRVSGLVAGQQHNGKPGTVSSGVDRNSGRIIVTLDDGGLLNIQPCNLVLIQSSSTKGRALLKVSSRMSFEVGSRVRVSGLVAGQQHNGKPGTVSSGVDQSSGRIIVTLDDGGLLKIQPCNLVSISPGSPKAWQLLCHIDVPGETSFFNARLLLLLAFQCREKHLQNILRQRAIWRPSHLLVSAARTAYSHDSSLKAEHRLRLLTCCRISVTLAARLMCFRSAPAIQLPLKHAACIMSRRHELPLSRLGAVARGGVSFVRHIPQFSHNKLFDFPRCVAFDGDGNMAISDSLNHCIKVCRCSDGVLLRTIGRKGAGMVQFKHPWGIAFDAAGHLVVSEYEGHRVQVLRYSDGTHICTFGKQGSGNEHFSFPSGIAVDGDGNVAVFDDGNCRVQVHRLCDGAYIRTIGSSGSGNGQFGGGRCVAFDLQGNLVVADRSNHRIQVLRYSDGAHLRTIGSQGAGVGQFFSPSGLAFDAAGQMFVAERDNHRVQVLRYSDGSHVRTIIIGRKGSGDSQFNEPGGIAVGSDGCIVMADTQNNRVKIFK